MADHDQRRLDYARPGGRGPSLPPIWNAAGLYGAATAVVVFAACWLWADWAENVIRVPRLWYQSDSPPGYLGAAFVVVNAVFVRRPFSFAGLLACGVTAGLYVVYRQAYGTHLFGLN